MRPDNKTRESFTEALCVYRACLPPHLQEKLDEYFENHPERHNFIGEHMFVEHVHASGVIRALAKELSSLPFISDSRIHSLHVVCPWEWVRKLGWAMEKPEILLEQKKCVYVPRRQVGPDKWEAGYTKTNERPSFDRQSLKVLRAWASPWYKAE